MVKLFSDISIDVLCDDCESYCEERKYDRLCNTCTIYVWSESNDIVRHLYDSSKGDVVVFSERLELLKECLIDLMVQYKSIRFAVVAYGLFFEPTTIVGVVARDEEFIADVVAISMLRMAYLVDASTLVMSLLRQSVRDGIRNEVRKLLELGQEVVGLRIEQRDCCWVVWPHDVDAVAKAITEAASTPFGRFALKVVKNALGTGAEGSQ